MTAAIGSARFKRAGVAVLAAFGWVALVLQLILHIQVANGLGLSLTEALIRFFSYFTIQINILAALVLTAFALKASSDEWLVHPFVRSAIAVYIAMVGITYHTLLRHLWDPQGAQWVADMSLHTVMPAFYLMFWLACVRKAGLRWYDPLLWLIYPLFYLAFVLVRGRVSGFYPYPFIDAGALGYAGVAVNTAWLLIVCAALGAVLVVVGWWLARRQTA